MDERMPKRLTIFAVPKAFDGHTEIIQRNAITSWTFLPDDTEVILLGNDAGVKEIADELGVQHLPNLKRNDLGTPTLDSVFQLAHEHAAAPLLMYLNSDIILNRSVHRMLDAIEATASKKFLAIGQRRDFDQNEPINFDAEWEKRIETKAERHGTFASILCKDYFVFPASMYQTIPAFSIGRGNWDSWMVANSVDQGIPVFDVTDQLFAGHQNHDHHHAGGRAKAYVTGAEAKQNKKLAGGTNYVSGSVATHKINANGQIQRVNRIPLLSFVWDFPKWFGLVLKLIRG